jgi:hypothetical protein
MNKTILLLLIICLIAGCKNDKTTTGRIPVAEIDKKVLYYDDIPQPLQQGINRTDRENYCLKRLKRI